MGAIVDCTKINSWVGCASAIDLDRPNSVTKLQITFAICRYGELADFDDAAIAIGANGEGVITGMLDL